MAESTRLVKLWNRLNVAASPPDVRKVYDLPNSLLFDSGLRPRLMGEAQARFELFR